MWRLAEGRAVRQFDPIIPRIIRLDPSGADSPH
jgi:hypothetical protein